MSASRETSGATAVGSPRLARVLVLQHDHDTDSALIGEAAVRHGASLHTCIVPDEVVPTSPEGFDAIVVLGSADSVNDPSIASWFGPETLLLQAADRAGVPVLGICFGAQALAVALGGSVTRAPYGEYGWKMVDTTRPDVVPEGPWFQWHVDAITPPPGAEVLASSDCCVQAYRIGPHLAVQFHPEITEQHATEWPVSDPAGLAESGLSAQDMIDITRALLPEATTRANALWDAFATSAASFGSDR